MHRVPGDGEPRSGDVVVAEIGQRLLEFVPPLEIGARDLLSGGSRLPHAQQPDPVEPHAGDAVEFCVGNVIQRGCSAQAAGQVGQPDAGVDLVQRRVTRCGLLTRPFQSHMLRSHGPPLSSGREPGEQSTATRVPAYGVEAACSWDPESSVVRLAVTACGKPSPPTEADRRDVSRNLTKCGGFRPALRSAGWYVPWTARTLCTRPCSVFCIASEYHDAAEETRCRE